MALVGYARVSTDDQDLQLQRDALNEIGCIRIFEDKISGKALDRPGLNEAIDYCRPGDTLATWRLDRLSRSLIDLVNTIDDLARRDIGVKVLSGPLGNIDPRTADGRLMISIFAALAEFERSLIIERTKAGLDAARKQGVKLGRNRVLDADKVDAARARRARGESFGEIARALGVGKTTVHRYLTETEAAEAEQAQQESGEQAPDR